MTQEQIIAQIAHVAELRSLLRIAEAELYVLESSPNNHRFDDMEVAERKIEEKLENEAEEDCEGKYNCGNPQYTQEFYVNDVLYVGILDVEYNRHDKMYYYVEESTFTVKKVEE
jgi:hypothetical protein